MLDVIVRWFGGGASKSRVTDILAADVAKVRLQADDPRLPSASRERVARLILLADEIDARVDPGSTFVAAHAEVERIRNSHVPQLISSYAQIPPRHRAEIFRRTGRSASYTLNAGLDSIIARLEQLSRMLAQADIDGFTANSNFIEKRYGADDMLA